MRLRIALALLAALGIYLAATSLGAAMREQTLGRWGRIDTAMACTDCNVCCPLQGNTYDIYE